ncbi:hypothetical protein ALC53_05527 [Atta colombica]|uniref:Uncharacterized protein n=1 Tax=Atta colombica TaxID=520822 RepID=A0A195BIN4_9HYME|nr:hypothetical protein ALC53_05527 [Atta colombica]
MRRQRPAEAPKAVHMNTSLSISTRMERRAPAQVSSRCMIDTRRSNLTQASRCWLDHREIQCNRYTLNLVCYSHCACLTGITRFLQLPLPEKARKKERLKGNGREKKKDVCHRRVPLRRSYFLFFFSLHSVSPVDRSLGRWLATSFNERRPLFLLLCLSSSRVLFQTRPLSVYSLPR